MAKVVWTEPALDNINDIAEYIAVSNPVAAKQLVSTLFDKVDRLEMFLESGRIVEEVKELGYREVVVNPCRIFYKIEKETVFILHVLRQERDLRRYILASKALR
ncbi:MAG: toxin ParE1/3/4 [Motiliproteus sp.]|jgi:toxin ParE1/3/4